MITINKDKALAQAKANKLVEVKAKYNKSITDLIGDMDQYEVVSWMEQEKEARDYVVHDDVITPMLSGLIASRRMGESVLDLATKVIAKSDAYKVAYSTILGTYQARKRAINNAKTVEELNTLL
ncbi:MAG: hypothetical protein JHC33_09115 [Ignisphaera sp.]|nr:hypothetical protein [Ignisphaera sp.]